MREIWMERNEHIFLIELEKLEFAEIKHCLG